MEQDEPNEFKRYCHQEIKSIRKYAREQIYHSRRLTFSQSETQTQANCPQTQETAPVPQNKRIIDQTLREQISQIMDEPISNISFEEVVGSLQNQDVLDWHFGSISLRRMLLFDQTQGFIQKVIDSGLVPILIRLCSRDDYPQLKLEASWALANLACGNESQCNSLIFHNAHIKMIDFLRRNEIYMVDQAIWALGNLAVGGSQVRSKLIEAGVVEYLADLGSEVSTSAPRKMIIWAISNIIRSKPSDDPQTLKVGLRFMCRAFIEDYYKDSPEYAYYILTSLYMYGDPKTLLSYYEAGLIPALLAFCLDKCPDAEFHSSIYAAFVLLMKFSFSSMFMPSLIDQGLLQVCERVLLNVQDHGVIKQVLFTLSNVEADNQRNADELLKCQSLVKIIVKILQQGSQELKNEAAYIIGNAAVHANPLIISNLIDEQDLIETIATFMMNIKTVEYLVGSLTNLNHIIRLGQLNRTKDETKTNLYVERLLDIPNFAEWMEEFQYHENKEVYNAVFALWSSISQLSSANDDYEAFM